MEMRRPPQIPLAQPALPRAAPSRTHVAIVLGTLGGARFLPAQLESLLAQSHRDWSLWAHDDGSEDGTWEILRAFAAEAGARGHAVHLHRRQSAGGVAASYHWLLSRPELREAPHIAFCDQDDVWRPDRLARGIAALAHAPRDLPILASSAMALIDGEGRPLGLTRPRRGAPPPAPGLAACLAQCPTNAPTLLMNGAARDLAVSLPLPHPLPSLDWWLVALVLGTGGRILHDPACTVSYRQHGGNSLGEAGTWRGTGRRLALLRDGTYRRWRDALVAGLARAPLTPEAARAVAAYRAAPAAGLARHRALQSAGISRRGRASGLISLLGALTGRL